MHRLRLFLIALAAVAATPVSAQIQPSVFVFGDEELAWYLRQAVLRPMTTEIDGVDLAQIRQAEGDGVLSPVCYFDAVDRNSFVGVFRDTEQDIRDFFENDFEGASFSTIYAEGEGVALYARVVNIERCDQSKSVGVLIYDSEKRVRFFDSWTIDEKSSFLRFFWRNSEGVFTVSSCAPCGDASQLLWDRERDNFYWKYVGD